jgi:NADP-dependent aldehyde dehydrogenase
MELTGQSFLGSRRTSGNTASFQAFNPQTGAPLDPLYFSASPSEADEAVQLASEAFAAYAQTSGKTKAAFLRRIADQFESHKQVLADRAHLETALPMPRLLGEVGRTAGQLRLFASVVEEGSWVQARIDPALPDRQPLPRPDIRSMLRPLGPVAVFGASNFPLAFSVAGGDTASALASGCPVVVKAHPAHPGTSELAAEIITDAVAAEGLHPGVFTMLSSAPSPSPVRSAPAAPSWTSPPPVAIPSPASLKCPAAIPSSSFPALCAKVPPPSPKASSVPSP